MREIWLLEDLHVAQVVRPGGPGGLTGSGFCKSSRSCILARDLLDCLQQGSSFASRMKKGKRRICLAKQNCLQQSSCIPSCITRGCWLPPASDSSPYLLPLCRISSQRPPQVNVLGRRRSCRTRGEQASPR
jgi:hypothetical protein